MGCGKTTLCRNPLDELKPEHWETDLIINPQLTETQLIKAILAELREERKARSRSDLLQYLNRVLLDRIHARKDIALIIDESQNLDFETLEHLWLLSFFIRSSESVTYWDVRRTVKELKL